MSVDISSWALFWILQTKLLVKYFVNEKCKKQEELEVLVGFSTMDVSDVRVDEMKYELPH